MVLQKFCRNLTYSSKGRFHYSKWIDILEIFTDHEQKEKSRLTYSLYLDDFIVDAITITRWKIRLSQVTYN